MSEFMREYERKNRVIDKLDELSDSQKIALINNNHIDIYSSLVGDNDELGFVVTIRLSEENLILRNS